MNIEKIKTILNMKKQINNLNEFVEYSVIIPIVEIDGNLSLLFEIRSKNMIAQPGEICFPGGKIERNETPYQAAVREMHEEIGISEVFFEYLGGEELVFTPFNKLIHPFVVLLDPKIMDNILINNSEVDSVFTVPIDFFINNKPLKHKVKVKIQPEENFPFDMIPNERSYPWKDGKYDVYFYSFENKIIWGITAKIVYSFIKELK